MLGKDGRSDGRQTEGRPRWIWWPARSRKRRSEDRARDRFERPDRSKPATAEVAELAEEEIDSAVPLAWEATAGVAYLEIIEEQLREERFRKSSLEGRGVFVVTSAGGLVSLAAAFIASSDRAQELLNAGVRRDLIIASLVCLVIAGGGGIAANVPLKYTEPKVLELEAAVRSYWTGDRIDAAQQNALAWLATLARAREMNLLKSWFVTAALVAEGAAFACLATVAVLVLRSV